MHKYLFFLLLFYCSILSAQITPTDYSLQQNWAAGKMKGFLDMSFSPGFTIVSPDTLSKTNVTVNYDSTTEYDLFFVYPTVLVNVSGTAQIQPVNIATKAAAITALVLFSQYAQFGRVYAPYYRQGNLATFYPTTSKATQAAIFDTVVTDVIAAFDYYMQHYNNGKKVILVGHSQGSMALGMMLRKFETTPAFQGYLNKIFLSVLAGMETGPYVSQSGLTGGWWQTIPICQNPMDTACVMSWGTHRYGAALLSLSNLLPFNDSLVTHGLLYKTFNPAIHRVFMDPLGFTAVQKPVNYSVYPKAFFAAVTKTDYGVTTSNIAYTNMYYGSISNPNVYNYGLMIDSIRGIPGDKRLDPLDSSISDYHTYDNCVAIGNVICFIYEKMNRTCPYNYIPASLNEKIGGHGRLILYPDPAGDKLYISSYILYKRVEIYNMLGEKIALPFPVRTDVQQGGQRMEESNGIDVSDLPAGIYFIVIENEKERMTGRFVKE